MKALSLWQPWASFLAGGLKRVETRHWSLSHRGPLLIHAAKTFNRAIDRVTKEPAFRAGIATLTEAFPRPPLGETLLPFGKIVGRVNVLACVRVEEVHFAAAGADVARIGMGGGWQVPVTDLPFGDYSPGRYAIITDAPVFFLNPPAWVGRQGLFDVPDAAAEGFR